MENKDYILKTEIIRDVFHDSRKIKCTVPNNELELDENVHQGGTIFKTENEEYIDLEFQLKDFDEKELVKYVDFAENLYEKHEKHVSVYLVCPDSVSVLVKEGIIIKSDANFTISLSRIGADPCKVALEGIKKKICDGETLDSKDIEILRNLPMMCNRKDRTYFRLECFRIINRYVH